jgi:transaldolase
LTAGGAGRKHGPMSEVMDGLRIKIFADGANVEEFVSLAQDPRIRGFTTNPTLMRQAGVDDYGRFVKELTSAITDLPISFEVFSDEFPEMERQALSLREFGANVYVKIPITDTSGTSTTPLMTRLATAGVSINATALMTVDQVRLAAQALAEGPPAIISVFAGRIADAGVDPEPIMAEAKRVLRDHPNLELLWASPREVLNVVQADRAGCDIITMTSDLLRKLPSLGRDLDEFSLATVKMFRDDAVAARYEF